MRRYMIVLWAVLLWGVCTVSAQVSPDCTTAIPICNNTPINGGTTGFGIDDFNGSPQTGCLEQTTTGAIESNAAWYRFRTAASGQLGLNIGFDTSEDWDFALYRSNDCNNLGDPVRCNFFDNSDAMVFMGIGEDPTGDTGTVLYEDWLQVVPGEEYYLLINNFSNNNSGFSIQFSGNIFVTNPYDALDCSIITNLLGAPIAACDNENIILDATTPNAVQYDWFMDTGTGFLPISGAHNPTLQLTVSARYRVTVLTSDGDLILSDVQVVFSTTPTAFPVLDDIACSDMGIYDLSQKDNEALGNQDTNEFMVSYHRSQADAISGANSFPKSYSVSSGSETIYVRVASMAGPKCFDASRQFRLTVVKTPLLDFPYEVNLCEGDTMATIGETMPNPNYTYVWDSGETTANITVSEAGAYTLTATNPEAGLLCENTRSIVVVISERPEISDVLIEGLQNNNTVTIISDMEGDFEYQLDNGDFGPNNSFTDIVPGIHTVTIKDLNGCGTDTETIMVVGFHKFFTPNGDGINDKWQVTGISDLKEPVVFIYDRYGRLLKQLNQDSLGWDGRFEGRNLPASDYWFKLTYTDADGQNVTAKYLNNHFSLRR